MSYENTSITTNLSSSGGGDKAGPIAFAGVMLVMVGLFHAIQGFVALLSDDFYVTTQEYIFRLDLTTWGWIHLLLGLLVIAAGAGLFYGATWARVLAIIAASVSMLGNFAWLPNYPIWGLTLIALDVFIIWAVIVHGRAFVDE
jgi:hypothetical protein